MMKLEHGYRGLVWEVPLDLDLGFGYVRFTNIPEQFGWYIHILNHRSNFQIKKFDLDLFSTIDELVAPFLGFDSPIQRGKDKWKPIGYLPIKDEDLIVPDFKVGNARLLLPELVDWYIIRGTSTADYLRNQDGDVVPFNYQQVKHLGFYGHYNLKLLTPRITLEWMKILQIDYVGYGNNSISQDFLEDLKYFVTVSTPYSEVPKEIRGKVLI